MTNKGRNPNETDGRERRILTLTCFGHFMSHFNMLVFPAILLPLAERMNADMADVLGISFWMYLLFGLTALPWGMAADRWGAAPLLLVFYLGAGLSGLASAFWLDSPLALTICLAGIGLFSGIYHPAGLGWISKEVRRVSLGMAYNGMFGNLGLASAPLLAGAVNWMWGPRAVYVALGLLNLSGLCLILLSPKDRAGENRRPASGEEKDVSVRSFFILLICMMLGGLAYRGATVILPAYFELKNQDIFRWLSAAVGGGISPNMVATGLVSLIYLLGMAGQYAGGRVGERFELRYAYLTFHCMTIPAAFLMYMVSDIPLVGLAMIYFFFLLGMQPVENTLVARFTPKKFHSAAYGTKFVLTFGVGSLAVKIMEIVKTSWGIEWAFPVLGLISSALVAGIGVLILTTRTLMPRDESGES